MLVWLARILAGDGRVPKRSGAVVGVSGDGISVVGAGQITSPDQAEGGDDGYQPSHDPWIQPIDPWDDDHWHYDQEEKQKGRGAFVAFVGACPLHQEKCQRAHDHGGNNAPPSGTIPFEKECPKTKDDEAGEE